MNCRSILVVAVFSLIFATPATAQLNFTLSSNVQEGIPGSTVTFSGTLMNTGSSDVFLNGDGIYLSNTLMSGDDSPFFNNAPLSLSSGQSYTGALFTVTISPSDVAPDSGTGSFTIIGGADANAQLQLATQNFSVHVISAPVPGPGALTTTFLGGIPGVIFILRRQRGRLDKA